MTLPDTQTLDLWLSRLNPDPAARLRLFAFPYAGAGTVVYRTWAAGLPKDVELNVIRLPGRESRLREQPYTQMQPLVTALVDAIQSTLDKPFAFFGHSMGGLVAFETARELRRRGLPMPLHLLISARRAPHLPDPDTLLYHLPDSVFVKEMQRRYDGIPVAILQTPELLALFVPMLKADFQVIETYTHTPEAPLDVPISAFGGTQDFVLRAGDLDGWREHTTQAFGVQKFVGKHFYLQTQQAALLAAVSKILTAV